MCIHAYPCQETKSDCKLIWQCLHALNSNLFYLFFYSCHYFCTMWIYVREFCTCSIIDYSLILFSDSQRLRPTIHEIITSKIKAHAELINSSRSGISQAAQTGTTGLHFMKGQLKSYQLPKQKRQNGISLAGTLLAVSPVSAVMAPMGKAQTTAKELLDSILDSVIRIFGTRMSCYIIISSTVKLNLAWEFFREPCCCWRASGVQVQPAWHKHS